MIPNDVAWILEFDELVAAITLELGGTLEDKSWMAATQTVANALQKYFRPECMWSFDSVASVTAEEILNAMGEQPF